MKSLDASYALLSDVSARNYELQTRLRNSLPLLWTGNALVMKSTARPRRRRVVAEQSTDGEPDQMLSAVEDQSSHHVSRRYKRRIEWEVARRIARVNRELQQYPPAQRFWNQKRREVAFSPPLAHKQHAKIMEKTRVGGTTQTLCGDLRQNERNEANAKATAHKLEKKCRLRPKISINAATKVERVFNNADTSQLQNVVKDFEQNKNTDSNAATEGQHEAKYRAKNTKQAPLCSKTVAEIKIVVRKTARLNTEVIKPQREQQVLGVCMKKSSTNETFDVCESISSSVVGPLTKDMDTVDSNESFLSQVKEKKNQQVEKLIEERPLSSIVRQVLSEFRTMPSVASFGSKPILYGIRGNPAEKRLSADCLRLLFSDLDIDKDGHVNRIETCVALHRLQISVPTAKIISFFHHIHLFHAKGMQSLRTQHLPAKEVINYKEFVAFVTAAFDQQQQLKVQQTQRKVLKGAIQPRSVPPTSLPIYTNPTSLPVPEQYFRESPTPKRGNDIRVDDVNADEFEKAKKIKETRATLVNRINADKNRKVSVNAEKNAVSLVRMSVESLIERKAAHKRELREITHELIRERLRNSNNLTQHATDDITGLNRAATYSNEKIVQGDPGYCSDTKVANTKKLENWILLVIDEHISDMVQQICRDKQASSRVSLAPTEDVCAKVPEDSPVRSMDEDVIGLSAPVTQGFNDDNREKSTTANNVIADFNNYLEKSVNVPNPISNCSTHIGKSIHDLNNRSLYDNSSRDVLRPVPSNQVFQQLRQERQLHQSSCNKQRRQLYTDDLRKISYGESMFDHGGEENSVNADTEQFIDEDLGSSLSGNAECVCQLHIKAEQHILGSLDRIRMYPMHDLDSATNESSLNSDPVSSGVLSSFSDSDSEGVILRQEIDHQLKVRERSICRRFPYWRHIFGSASESSIPDSICSAELSEGELLGDDAMALSDGEIFGECKSRYIRRKKAISILVKSNEEDSQHSSVESGELPALMRTRRQQVSQSSSSSVESGELKDGALITDQVR